MPRWSHAFERIEAARGEIALTYFEFGTLAALLAVRRRAARCRRARSRSRRAPRRGQHPRRRCRDRDHGRSRSPGLARQRSRQHRPREGRHLPARATGDHRRARATARLARRDGAHRRRPAYRGPRFPLRDSRRRLALAQRRNRARSAASRACARRASTPTQPRRSPRCTRSRSRLGWNPQAIAQGVRQRAASARLQRFASAPEFVIDVAHNPQAARVLARLAAAHAPAGRTLAVFGALADKDVRGIVEPLRRCRRSRGICRAWRANRRADSRRRTLERVRSAQPDATRRQRACGCRMPLSTAAFADAKPGDRIVAFGSFFIAAAALRFAAARGFGAALTRIQPAGRV